MTEKDRFESEKARLIRTAVFDAVPEDNHNILIARSDREQTEFVRLLDQEMGIAEEIARLQIEQRVVHAGPNELQTIPFAWCITQRLAEPSTGQVWVVTADAASPYTLEDFVVDSKWGVIYWPDESGVYETCPVGAWEKHWKSHAMRSDAQIATQYVWRDPSLDIIVCDPDSDYPLRFDLRPPKEELVKDVRKSSWQRLLDWNGEEVKKTWQRRRAPRRPR